MDGQKNSTLKDSNGRGGITSREGITTKKKGKLVMRLVAGVKKVSRL
jgi:hypothetical protein